MEMFESLEKAMCKELEAIEQKVKGGAEMTVQDLDKADKLAHALKSLAAYRAMHESEMYGMSGARGRDGRYMSRDMGPGYSGHYPPYGYGYPERNW